MIPRMLTSMMTVQVTLAWKCDQKFVVLDVWIRSRGEIESFGADYAEHSTAYYAFVGAVDHFRFPKHYRNTGRADLPYQYVSTSHDNAISLMDSRHDASGSR